MTEFIKARMDEIDKELADLNEVYEKKSEDKYYNRIWDNTLTYNDQFGKHKVGAMVGMSMREEQWRNLNGSTSNVPDGEKEYWYIKNGNASGATVSDDG